MFFRFVISKAAISSLRFRIALPAQKRKRLPVLTISRRGILKAATLVAAGLLLIPAERLVQFLFAPRETGPASYPRTRVSNTRDIPLNESLLFEYPHKDRPAILIHLPTDEFVAFDAICTHLGCQVHYDKTPVKGWESNPLQIFSPCHAGVFEPKAGGVIGGPPPRPLPKIRLEIDSDGEIFANGYESGLPLYGEGGF
jgi:Rieske Fe-S protein